MSFEESRIFAQNLNLVNEKDWKKFCISGKKPEKIPLNPKKDYSFEWKGWSDWLGITKRKYLPYVEAKEFVSDLTLDTKKEWKLFYKSGKLPENIPVNPKNVYTSAWKYYDDWLGVRDREYLSFEQAKKFVSGLIFDYPPEWKKFCISGKKPKNIPAKPFKYFSKKGRLLFDIYDWFGINEREYLPFEEAKIIIRNLKFTTYEQYREWDDSSKPKIIPGNPSYVYREKGWYSYADWTGIHH